MRLYGLLLLCFLCMVSLSFHAVAAEGYTNLASKDASPLSVLARTKKTTRVSPQKRVELSSKAIDKWTARQAHATSMRIQKQEAQAELAAAKLKKKRIQKRNDRIAKQQQRKMASPVESLVDRPHERMAPSLLADAVRRTKELIAMQANAVEGGIMLEPNALEQYLLRGPRTYNVLLTFTALGSNWRCTHCHQFNEASKAFLGSLAQQQAPLLAAPDADTLFRDGYPTISMLIDPNKHAMLWRTLALQQAPLTVLLPPSFTADTLPALALIDSSLPRHQLSNTPSAADIITFLQRNHAPAPPPPGAKLDFSRLLVLLAVVVAAGASAYFFWDNLSALSLGRLRLPAAVLFLVGYMVSVSGFKFNSLQNTPFSEVDRYGVPRYVADGFQRQFGAESFIMFAVYGTLAIGFILLIGAAYQKSVSTHSLGLTPVANERYHPTVDDTTTDANIAGFIISRSSPVVAALFIGMITAAYFQMLSIFARKQPAYGYGLLW